MKKIILAASLLAFTISANAQSASSTATQQVSLGLSDAISITAVTSGTGTADPVNMNFNTVADYASGVISSEQMFKVQSNKHFNVTVQTNSLNFSYTGSASPAPTVQISNVLKLLVTTNNTGGSLSYSSYAAIPSGTCTILNWCSPGGNQTFGVKYKATPGFSLPGGTYTATVVYTATQL